MIARMVGPLSHHPAYASPARIRSAPATPNGVPAKSPSADIYWSMSASAASRCSPDSLRRTIMARTVSRSLKTWLRHGAHPAGRRVSFRVAPVWASVWTTKRGIALQENFVAYSHMKSRSAGRCGKFGGKLTQHLERLLAQGNLMRTAVFRARGRERPGLPGQVDFLPMSSSDSSNTPPRALSSARPLEPSEFPLGLRMLIMPGKFPGT